MVQQIAVFIENRKGRLQELTKVLTDNDIDLIMMSIADTSDYGILRAITCDNEKAAKVLKAHGFTVSTNELIGVEVSDKPGGLNDVLDLLNRENVDIEYLYSFARVEGKKAIILFRVEEEKRAIKVLKDNKIKLIENID